MKCPDCGVVVEQLNPIAYFHPLKTCLRNQLAQAKEEIEELRKHNTQLDEENATLDVLREAVEKLRDECVENADRLLLISDGQASIYTALKVTNSFVARLTRILEAADAE